MKRMLINATQEEELRMAMVDGQRLYDLNIELPAGERKKANIYKGQITRIEPSLEAAFVNYGADRHGFLPLKEISSEYFVKPVESGGKPNIRDVLKEGQDIVIQIDKEERGNKGAALTTYVSLAGRFIVLKPNKSRSGGVSRRIVGEDRDLARKSMHEVEVPKGMSVILRTAGIDRSAEELEWDLSNLMAVWEAILKVVVERDTPFLIYRESNAVVRALRDYLTNEIGEILIDDEATWKEAVEFVEQVMPQNLKKLKHYTDPVPLFTRYQIESQIESAFSHLVTLPSGGSIVIDHTEALVSIDINSARATKGGDIEATALNTNLEAADEVGRQLRLRDLGGLVVIDFIDMGPQRNQREVENRLRDSVRQDRARVQIGKISRFGLLEMSRQRLRPSLGESSYLTCPRCSGIGNIRSVESLALAILRIIGEEARKERTAKVIAQLPVEVATYLLNEKRDWVQSLESRNDTQVVLVANSALETPHYQIRRVRDDQTELPENVGNSYTLSDGEEEEVLPQSIQERKVAEPAAIQTVVATTPVPVHKPTKKTGPGLIARISALFGSEETETKPDSKRRSSGKKADTRRRSGPKPRRRNDAQRDNRNAKRTSERPAKKGKAKRKTSGGESEPKKTANENKTPQHQESVADSENRNEPRKTGSKRRSRGGRRRRKPAENATAETSQQQAQETSTESEQKPVEQPKKRQSKPRPAARDGAEAPKTDAPKTVEVAAEPAEKKPPRTPRPRSEKPKAEKSAEGKTADAVENKREEPGSPKPPAPEKKSHSQETSFDATRPELPVIKPQEIEKPQTAKTPVTATKVTDAEPASKVKADKPAAEAKPARDDSQKKASSASAPGNGEKKPEGSLLPWDQVVPADKKPAAADSDSDAPNS